MSKHFRWNRETNEVTPCTMLEWASGDVTGSDSPERARVAEDTVGERWVSTVFLGLDHQFGEGPPLVFETMVFSSKDNLPEDPCERYSTPAEAREGHKRVCELVRQGKHWK